MTGSPPILSPSVHRRTVLFAVALVDPITGALVSKGVSVSAKGLVGQPIINHSGYFVWLAEGDARPSMVTVASTGAPFEPQTAAPPPLPASLDQATPEQRLKRILLRPSAAYPFPDGVAVVFGRLVETSATGVVPVPGVDVELQWRPEAGQQWVTGSAGAVTGANGEFSVGLRLPAGARAAGGPDRITLRVKFDRGVLSRATPEGAVPPGGRTPAPGGTPGLGVVAWDQLTPA